MKRCFALVSVMAIAVAACPAQSLKVEAVGQFQIDSGDSGAEQLSGLSYVGPVEGNVDTFLYYAISDSAPRAYGMEIRLDMTSGAVVSAKVVSTITLSVGTDLEGIAYNQADDTIYVSDEDGPAIRKYYLKKGQNHRPGDIAAVITVPAVFSTIRQNLGFEALTMQSGLRHLWTANQEALTVDGERSTTEYGSVVRLLKYDSRLNPSGQWAYVTDPIRSNHPEHKYEESSVCDMAVLPDGRLIVLEREIDIRRFLSAQIPYSRNRLYEVDFTSATDISAYSDGLKDKEFTPVSKHMLWENRFIQTNYEGLSLGPRLTGNRWSLLMISDNQSGIFQHSLYALRVARRE